MVHLNCDILSLIFIEALHTGSSSVSTLGLVKRAWYEIARRTPQLWTRLVLNRKSHFTNLKYAQLYLRKSCTLPIDIHIALPDDVDLNEMQGVAGLLHNQTTRFRSFDFHSPTRHELEEFIFLMAEGRPAPLLESLKLTVQSCTPYDTVCYFVYLLTAFTPAPRLAHIEIPGWPLQNPFPRLPNMTSFIMDSMSLDFIPIDEVISFLSSTPALRHFVYKGRGQSAKIVADFDYVVHLPDLVTVDVTAPGSGADILCLINAPALMVARLDGFRELNFEELYERFPPKSLTETVLILSRRSRNLRRLTLEYMELLDIPGCFEVIFNEKFFPRLEEVVLIATGITDEALMNAGKNSGLKRLKMRGCEWVTGTRLLEFVRHRGSDFSLSLQGCRNLNVTQEDMNAISEMITVEGLH